MSAIRLGTAACVLHFQSLASGLQSGDDAAKEHLNPEALEDEHGRFRVWSGNLGALQKGHSSLDYRLRDSPLLQSNILKLLDELRTNLSEALAIVSGSRLPYEKQANVESEDDDDDWSQNEEDSDDDSDRGPPKFELVQRFLDIIDIIDNLYKLSVRIRSPTLRSRSLKAATFKPVDPETGVDTFEQYAAFDMQFTRELLSHLRSPASDEVGPADEYLVERLSKAITLRRRQFKYWKRHRDKLGASFAAADTMMLNPLKVTPDLTGPQTTPEGISGAQKSAAYVPLPQSDWAPKSMLSGTEATHHHHSLDEIVDSQSVTSYATTTRDLTGHGIELPPPPKQAIEDRDFECPYCYIICPSRYGRARAWRTHLLQDLQPYICTYEDCPIGDQLFRSRREWIEHEAGHRKLWRCPEHRNSVYRSSGALKEHLHSAHLDNFPEDQVDTIVRVGESSSVDLRPRCPICLADATMDGGLQNHLANHLERLAAFALPRDIDTAADYSEGGSGIASRGRSELYSASQDLSVDSEKLEAADWDWFEDGTPFRDLSSNIEELTGKVSSLDARYEVPDTKPGTALSSDLLKLLPDSSTQQMESYLSSNKLESNEPQEQAPQMTRDSDYSDADSAPTTRTAKLHFEGLPQNDQTGLLQQFLESRHGYRSMSGLVFSEDRCSGHAKFTNIMTATNALEAIDGSQFPGVIFSVTEKVSPVTRFADYATIRTEPEEKGESGSDLGFAIKPLRDINNDHVSTPNAPYKVMDGVVPLSKIPNLPQLYAGNHLPDQRPGIVPSAWFNKKISLFFSDITMLGVDVIVNAVARNLSRSDSDLSRLIHKFAGPELEKEVKSNKAHRATGEVVMTDAYRLPCKKILHAARPHYASYDHEKCKRLLAKCYRGSLEMAEQHNLKSIAFPTLSAGGFGFPSAVAAEVAVQTVRDYLDSGKGVSIDRIVFCVFTERHWQTYWKLLPTFFPSAPDFSESSVEYPSLQDDEGTEHQARPIHKGTMKLDALKTSSEHRYSAYVWELKELHEHVEGIAEDLIVFRDKVPEFEESIIRELTFISSTLADMEKFFISSSTGPASTMTEHQAADLDLICVVLRSVAGGVHEIIMQTNYTRNLGVPTHKDIWESYSFHLKNDQGLTFLALVELCGNFIQSLTEIIKWNGREPDDMGILRDKLARYRLKQSGGGVPHVPNKMFDEALLTREFAAGTWEPKGQHLNIMRSNHIPSLSRLYQLGDLEEDLPTTFSPSSQANNVVCLIKYDITRLQVDAIINSTDMAFAGLGALDKAIFEAGGLTMQEDCAKFGILNEGSVRLTQGYLLPCRNVIHTVPPEYYSETTVKLLRKCYQESLKMADNIRARTVAFPVLGGGLLNYPPIEAATLAMVEVRQFLDQNNTTEIEKIIFCVFDETNETTYRSLLPQFFPPVDSKVDKVLSTSNVANESKERRESVSSAPIQIPGGKGQPSAVVQPNAEKEGYERQNSVTFSQSLSARKSRPLDTDETWALDKFEAHAADCQHCHGPLDVYHSYGKLCEDGHRLAQEVADLLFVESGGTVYSTALESGHRVQVTLGAGYEESRGLLNAINWSLRQPGRSPFVNMNLPFTPHSISELPIGKDIQKKRESSTNLWSTDWDAFPATNYSSEPIASQSPPASSATTEKVVNEPSIGQEGITRFSSPPYEQIGGKDSQPMSERDISAEGLEGHYSYTNAAGMSRDTEPSWRGTKEPTNLKHSDSDAKKFGALAILDRGVTRSILRQPTSKFPEDTNPIREGVAPIKGTASKNIPLNARWTSIDRKLVDAEALNEAKERFEERIDRYIVLRVLTKEEIRRLAERTQEIRAARAESDERVERRSRMRRGSLDEVFKPRGEQVSSGSQKTKFDRQFVSPEALREANEPFEEGIESVTVLRRLTKDEVQDLADRTTRIRNARPAAFTIEGPFPQSAQEPREEQLQPRTPTVAPRSLVGSPHGLPGSYINQVKAAFADQPDVVEEFEQLLRDFRSGRTDSPGALHSIHRLFEGKPDLVHGFNIFLPPGYRTEGP